MQRILIGIAYFISGFHSGIFFWIGSTHLNSKKKVGICICLIMLTRFAIISIFVKIYTFILVSDVWRRLAQEFGCVECVRKKRSTL